MAYTKIIASKTGGYSIELTKTEEMAFLNLQTESEEEKSKFEIQTEINNLETLETPKRIAEAILDVNEGKKWLIENRKSIDDYEKQLDDI